MPEHKLSNLLLRNQRVAEALQDLRNSDSIRLKDFWKEKSLQEKPKFTELTDINEIEEVVKTAVPLHDPNRKPELKQVTCLRCFNLSKAGKVTQIETPTVHKDPETLFKWVMEQIPDGSIVLNVVDLLDFDGTQLPQLKAAAQQKRLEVILVANKVDVLPKGYHIERVHKWVLQQTHAEHVCVVSSASGQGLTKVVGLLKRFHLERPRAEIFVLGVANSGKSTFINRLAKMTWDLPMRKYKEVKLVDELTTSPIPGTTLNVVQVQLARLKIAVKDTPGIPNLSQVTTHLSDPEALSALVPRKKLNPVVITLNDEISLFFGGLARMDLTSGNPKLLTIFTSNMVTLHRTRREKADSVFLKHNGNLLLPAYPKTDLKEFRVTEVKMECEGYKQASKDIAVHGLGWVSVTGSGPCTIEVRAPLQVGVTVRNPLMPFEAKIERLVTKKVRTVNLERWTKYRHSQDKDSEEETELQETPTPKID